MKYKEFKIKVKECINFLKYCEELIERLDNEYKYYKNEMDNEDYGYDDFKAILYGTLDRTERKCLKKMIEFVDWYIVEYGRSHLERDRKRYTYRHEILYLLINGSEYYGIRKFYFYNWLAHIKKCYKPMKAAYYDTYKEILVSKNFIILNKLYELIQEIKNI